MRFCPIWTLLFLMGATPMAAGRKADVILKNGVIRTLWERCPLASAMAVGGGRVLAVGGWADVEPFQGPETRVMDLGGTAVYPGFVDAHAHVYGLGKSLEEPDLGRARSPREAAESAAAAAGSVPPGKWVEGRGWDQTGWDGGRFPSASDLDKVISDRPVALRRVDGHALWVNTKALDVCGITGRTRVEGGRVMLDGGGNPTGVLVDKAMGLVLDKIPQPSAEDIRRRLIKAMDVCARWGLTEVHDAGVDRAMFSEYRRLSRRGEMPIRVWGMLEGPPDWLEKAAADARRLPRSGFFTAGGVKLYADGALGSRGARLLAPYSDAPDQRGIFTIRPDELSKAARFCAENRLQLCVHAIGDAANRMVLDLYEPALDAAPDGRDRRFRIEHAQVLSPQDIPRFAALGVIPAMQPTHCTSDMPWAPLRLGQDRLKGAYAWQSLIRSGCLIPTGSDFPVEGVNPLFGFHSAVTRRDDTGQPPGGWSPDERMTRDQALRAMTVWAAYARFNEKDKGVLAPGMVADATGCDRDIATAPEEDILKTEIRFTMVGGRLVYVSASQPR